MKSIFYLFLLMIFSFSAYAQDSSLLKMLNDSMKVHEKPFYVSGTFKATHIVNMQTIEAPGAGALNFVIQHRFGQLNSGSYNFFGLDNATLRLGLDYGISDRFAVGIGRSTYEKTYDAYVKYKLLRQTDATNKIPVSISLLGQITYYTLKYPEKPYLTDNDRISYTAQLLIARKLTRNLSLQLVPTYLHYNLVATPGDKNNIFALGAGGRMKITRRMSINVEYNYLPSGQIVSSDRHDSFSLGWDIETGGHVFQLVFSNSQSIVETQYITQTTGRWGNGDIYFGFNVSRNFNVTKKAKGSKH
ncbi:MAG: hypothetical protein JST75_15120 [Bacteroidetes bacterium]|nr:hypothetical protein [Bacteroidota bacterium]